MQTSNDTTRKRQYSKKTALSKEDWDRYRGFIYEHYINKRATLVDISTLLETKYHIKVTRNQLEHQRRRWKFRKNVRSTPESRSQPPPWDPVKRRTVASSAAPTSRPSELPKATPQPNAEGVPPSLTTLHNEKTDEATVQIESYNLQLFFDNFVESALIESSDLENEGYEWQDSWDQIFEGSIHQ
ncbi:hypothetical protein TWF102_006962 [Orbilia oligospora]|uniref:Clr5 domain-containing protein n=1 Tax=Orbilia oligospora TaxID=2813651 RepID=A0A7C8JFL2_ORBOL|nr:hypothetical protein TWF103_005835 [Orbilia oligospora]KAF3111289.1 hypothetical protein TWF102_006962 [Orbilia oligospora]